MLIENFVIKEKKHKEFQDWVKSNERTLASLSKKSGMKYLGTYYYSMGTGAHVNASGCFMFELSKYSDIDSMTKLFNDPADAKMSREMTELLVSMPHSILFLRPFGEGLFYKGT